MSGDIKIVGNKAEGPISKRVFQENKARQIFQTTIFYPLVRTRTEYPYSFRISQNTDHKKLRIWTLFT